MHDIRKSPSAASARPGRGAHPSIGDRIAGTQGLAGRALTSLTFVASLVAPGKSLADGLLSGGANGFWNDFASYWLAGKLVWSGHSPYDLTALARLGQHEGLVFTAGTGYSYPLPFAVAMVPLGWLPFGVAGLVFSLLSLLVFGLAVTTWLRDGRLFRGPPLAAVGLAALAGYYPPVTGSVFFGQANLLVFGLLVLGVRTLIHRPSANSIWGGAALGLAGIVKVAPLGLVAPLVIARRWRETGGLICAAGAAFIAALVVAPFALAQMGRLLELGVADPYWTNQSINGFASRLVISTERTVPPLPHADPGMMAWATLMVLGVVTFGVMLWRRRSLLGREGFALALGMTLVAATAGAPKNSFWNHVPALLGAGLLLAVPAWRHARPQGLVITLLVAWFALAAGQRWIDGVSDEALRGLGPMSAFLSSLGLYSLLVLWLAALLAFVSFPARDGVG